VEVVVTVFSTPDDGCCDTRNMYSDFAVNKYLHTVASGWIFINTELGTMSVKKNPVNVGLQTCSFVNSSCQMLFNHVVSVRVHTNYIAVKVKQSQDRPRGFQEVEVPIFQDNRHMKVVRLSTLHTGCLYSLVT